MKGNLSLVILVLQLGCSDGGKSVTQILPEKTVSTKHEIVENRQPELGAIGLPTPSTINGGLLNDRAKNLPLPIYPKAALTNRLPAMSRFRS